MKKSEDRLGSGVEWQTGMRSCCDERKREQPVSYLGLLAAAGRQCASEEGLARNSWYDAFHMLHTVPSQGGSGKVTRRTPPTLHRDMPLKQFPSGNKARTGFNGGTMNGRLIFTIARSHLTVLPVKVGSSTDI